MSPLGIAASAAIVLFATLTIVGLVSRRRIAACVLFPVYLASAAIGHGLVLVHPGVFWTWEFWTATDALQTTLRMGIAFEIAFKVFRPPLLLGRKRIRVTFAVVTVAILLVVALVPMPVNNAFELARVLERVSYGTAFLFLAFVGIVHYYGVPLDPLHRNIATGFGVVTVLVGCVSALWRFDPIFGMGRDFIVKTAYPALLAWWAVSAWRREDFGLLSAETVRRLQPWRVR